MTGDERTDANLSSDAAADSERREHAPDSNSDQAWSAPRRHIPNPERISSPYPRPAGTPLEFKTTPFEARKIIQEMKQRSPCYPFSSEGEWEFAEWLMKSGLSQKKIEDLLTGGMVSTNFTYSSFKNKAELLAIVDSLPGPRASWRHIEIRVQGNVPVPNESGGKTKTEKLDLWARDPVEVISDLISHPAFKDDLAYAPVRVTEQSPPHSVFEEMEMCKWWREMQDLLPEGATIAPVILASDKTQLTTLSGDKQAWPVYLSIGNLKNAVRRQPSKRATVLLGYLPVSKLECFEVKDRQIEGYRLFHFAMRQLLAPLIEAGKTGVDMICADGWVWRVYPLLAMYIADFPEQCLIVGCKNNRCPTCTVRPTERGEALDSILYRVPQLDPSTGRTSLPLDDPNDDYHPIQHPFWEDLPLVNIFGCITPDILHQLHKDVFKDHLVKWTTSGHKAEVDARFACVPPYPRLRIFRKGISKITQWTGNEYRQMQKVFIGILSGLHPDEPRVVMAACAVLDFIYMSHFPSHSTSTVIELRQAHTDFHRHKQVFLDIGSHKDFNIPKVHSMNHYCPSIIEYCSCLGNSTEISERLHIDQAKMGYRASNRRGYIKQMVVWLTRQEKIDLFRSYLEWTTGTVSSKSTISSEPQVDVDTDTQSESSNDDDDAQSAHSNSDGDDSEDNDSDAEDAEELLTMTDGARAIIARSTDNPNQQAGGGLGPHGSDGGLPEHIGSSGSSLEMPPVGQVCYGAKFRVSSYT
ncbi:hypothetical protein BV25DRAFT_1811991 [Artomyces pyxidatus]|uniref:Uncharacterized protein n=1 Tax=Artomyces pyxidatus TaxID=48021 RepID=A0ACB8SPQ1_9AGAM|nr:hypothetical protein BV25DRAFT_1811991 [Artomyces pyxidatus]